MKKTLFIFLVIGLFLSCKKTEYDITSTEGKQIPVSDSIAKDSVVEEFISPYKKSVRTALSEVLAYNANDMVKTRGELNTDIGNMMADVVMIQANPVFKERTKKEIDFVLLNHGGIRAALPKGEVTRRSAYEIMPFENEIVVLELSPEKISDMFQYLQSEKKAHPISGIKIKLDKVYEVTDIKIQGKPLDTSKTYFVATSDYLRNSGDRMYFFADAESEHFLNYKIRNALIDYFVKVDTVDYTTDNRFIRE